MALASMILRNIISPLLLALLTTLSPAVMAKDVPKSVVELFTSQSCSSCPPADDLLMRLSRQPGVIALTLPVDYWNYTGWEDTLGLPAHTERQRAYANHRGSRSIFTPQVIVGGVHVVKGHDEAAVQQAMSALEQHPKALSVPVSVRLLEHDLEVTLPETALNGETAEIWVCPVSQFREVEVLGGENNGHTLQYGNVVRGWVKLGDWTGQADQFVLPMSQLRHDGADKVVVLVQSGTFRAPGPILGAMALPLPENMRRASLPAGDEVSKR